MRGDHSAELLHIASACAYANISRVARAVTQTFDAALFQSGLSAGQFTILVAISLAGKTTIKPLAKQLQMDRTTLARNLRPLERKRLIEIMPGEDQRQRVIQLTSEGQEILLRAIPLWQQAQETVLRQIEPSEWAGMVMSLRGLAQSLSRET